VLLILDPAPPHLRWCHCAGPPGDWVSGADPPSAVLADERHFDNADHIALVLRQGGSAFREPVTPLTEEVLGDLESIVPALPEHNAITARVARALAIQRAEIPVALLCDTALFTRLPDEATHYALPESLRSLGARRRGGYGLLHHWAWEQIRHALWVSPERVVSVHLGNQTNVVALRHGRPVETSLGFTPVEGIVSSTGCGDIDPTIVFQLEAAGMSPDEIRCVLSQESGLTALAGRPCDHSDLLRAGGDDRLRFARQVYLQQVVKSIGASIALLGGVDVALFLCRSVADSEDLIAEIGDHLLPLGARMRPTPERFQASHRLWRLTEKGSPIAGLALEFSEWTVLSEMARGAVVNSGGDLYA
jgi:acetate kinase